MPTVCRHALVSGRVQGVGFRWHTRAKAEELGLAGWVKNLPDGKVEVWLEGEAGAIEAMLTWLAKGPKPARVTNLEVVERSPSNCTGFELRR